MTSSIILQQALSLAQSGIAVFPCLDMPGDPRDKRPATKNGFYNATCDLELVELWIWEGRLIGVPTGPVNHIAALDIDPRSGGLGWYHMHLNRLPKTRTHRTRSDGLHLVYRDSKDFVRNSANQLSHGVDSRGRGGYIVWWACHGYPVIDDRPLDQLAEWPDWLHCPNWLGSPEPGVAMARRGGNGGGGDDPIKVGPVLANRHRVAVLIQFVRDSKTGERNKCLFWAALRMAAVKFPDEDQRFNAFARLRNAAVRRGLSGEEAERTIESAVITLARETGE